MRSLLKPEGILYVGVPGLYTWDKDILFQQAHTYQFNATTLTYVMECCGFEEYYSDEHVTSLWIKSDIFRSKDKPPKHEVKNVWSSLNGKKIRVPEIRTTNKFPVKMRREQIQKALSYKWPDISDLVGVHKGAVTIIGGGPSVESYVDKIKSNGGLIICIERMYQWCINNAIVPDYVVALDADEDLIESFSNPLPTSTFLVSVQCPSSVFDALQDVPHYIFNTPQLHMDMAKFWADNGYNRVAQVNAGGSVTIGAMAISFMFGCKDLHIFGFDCHITNGNYAEGITGVGAINKSYQVDIGDRVFTTTTAYISFAQQFFEIARIAKEQDKLNSVKVYGDSLVNAMSIEDIRGLT